MDQGITIRHEIRPGDLGMVTHLHGVHYAREWGLDTTFEPYVARLMSEFVLAGPSAGRLWLAERGDRLVGCVALVNVEPGVGQLRWFLVTPEGRGTGLGHQLLAHALNYARSESLSRVYLWTFDGLDAALHLAEQDLWGRKLVEIRMDLDLNEKGRD
jgi:GNAT superfamily N-acetyltransferase